MVKKPSEGKAKPLAEEIEGKEISSSEWITKRPLDSGRFSRHILDVAPDGIVICDEKGIYLDSNQAYCRMLGISYEELIGKHIESYALPGKRDGFQNEFIPKMRKSGVVKLDTEIMSKDRTPIPVELTSVKFTFGGKPAYLSIIHDLRERKRREAELLASEERYRILTENVTDGVIVIQDKKLKFVNNAFFPLFGYESTTAVIGQGLEILLCPDLHEFFKKKYKILEKDGLSERIFVSQCHAKDGREFWIEARGKIITWEGRPAILSTLRDVTENRLKQIAVEEERENLFRENIALRSTMKDRFRLGDIVGKSAPIQEIYDLILKASSSDAGVAIYGESGTGKELIARTIHQMSARKDKRFVPVNCGAIPETLFESEFFGYKKGAFTGANSDKQGFFDFANEGTLFLDEVGELSTNNQVKLLRAIDGGGYMPVGGDKLKKANVRIVVATNRDPKEMIKKGLMREDFFYRVHIIPMTVPPLRDRRDDIPLLIESFLQKHDGEKKSEPLPAKIIEAMYSYEWPGNIRELQNVLQRYKTLGSIDFINIREPQSGERVNILSDANNKDSGLRETLETFEKQYIVKILDQNRWKRGKASKVLQVPLKTLYRKMKKYHLI